jgi:RimJ/RimL family protein N-acetyltransferase
MTVSLRRAGAADADYLEALAAHPDVDPFFAAARDRSRQALLEEIGRSESDPGRCGRFVIECDGRAAGTVGFELVNERSAIAEIRGLAIHPDFRGRDVGVEAARLLQRLLIGELGFHRLQLEVYGFNGRAHASFERAGFTREGTRRNAYRHGDGWTDGVLYGLVAEDLDVGSGPSG